MFVFALSSTCIPERGVIQAKHEKRDAKRILLRNEAISWHFDLTSTTWNNKKLLQKRAEHKKTIYYAKNVIVK